MGAAKDLSNVLLGFHQQEGQGKDHNHINEMIDKYSIPGYLDSNTIRQYYDYDTSYVSVLNSRKRNRDNLLKEFEHDPIKIWKSNIFGKSLHELVNEGLQNKLYKMPEDAQCKFQETLEKVINEGSGGLICIIL